MAPASETVACTLQEIAAALGGDLLAEGPIRIEKLASLGAAGPRDLSFVAQARAVPQIATTQAAALIVAPAWAEAAKARGPCIVTDDPYLYFARLTQWWRARRDALEQGAADTEAAAPPSIHPLASVDPGAHLASGVRIAAFAVVEAGAHLGEGTLVGAHAVIERNARVGAACRIAPRVVVGRDCHLGDRCILHAGVVIGADGFGFALHQGTWEKIEQLGAVRIGNDVEIGANTCIDRGALQDTVIEDGVKLDNLIQIGHNVHIGQHTAMAGCVGVAGSARIGAHCTVGGGAIILGHLSLADGVHISAASVVTRSIKQPGQYTGLFPIDDNSAWEKNAASLKQLHQLRDRIKALEALRPQAPLQEKSS